MEEKSQPILEFSAPRHRTIAEVADVFLEPKARKEIQKILAIINAKNLKEIATWADDIKPMSSQKPTDKETKDFLNRFHDTRNWHFVDLPVDATKYDVVEYADFVRDDDIVHISEECIRILLGHSTKFSQANGLRWLVHLVGDLHQPLHLACSYLDLEKPKPALVFDKDQIIKKKLLQKSDHGGNKIILGTGSKALHSYWDDDLPKMDNNFVGATYQPPAKMPKDKLIELPSQWVGDNVKYSKEAYTGLTVTGFNAKENDKINVDWDKQEYNKRCVPIIKILSLNAANRLAFLLNTIFT